MTIRNFVKIALLMTIFSTVLAPAAVADDSDPQPSAEAVLAYLPCVYATITVPPEITYVENCLPVDP